MNNAKFNSVVCFGEVLWDMLPDGAQPGGAPLNVAIHLKRQGKNPVIVSTVYVTRGANGAALFFKDELFEHPGFKVDAVDTVGAGDSFLAGLIAKLSDGCSPENALSFACATGAFVASQNGAVPDYSASDIEAIIT